MSQIDQAQKLLKRLNQDIVTAQDRFQVAQNQADNLEKRNQAVLATIEQEGNAKKLLIIEQAESRQAELDEAITKSEQVVSHLLKDIEKYNKQKTSLESAVDGLLEAKGNLDKQLETDSLKYQNLLDNILKATAELRENEEKINDKRTQIRELETAKQQVEADLEILQGEVANVENDIIVQDADFRSRKEYLDNQLYETNLKLKRALDSLIEAQNKDKAFRTYWAEEQMKLDKRTETVRRMEARVSDAESRIEELKRYDLL